MQPAKQGMSQDWLLQEFTESQNLISQQKDSYAVRQLLAKKKSNLANNLQNDNILYTVWMDTNN